VSLPSLARYRRALGDFVRSLPLWLQEPEGEPRSLAPAPERPLRAIGGGRA
jgi:hypothetical protein